MVMLSYTHRCLLNIFPRWHGIDLATYHSEPRFPFHSSTHLFTCVCLFARRCCRSKIFKGGRHICDFVEIVLGGNLQGHSQKRWEEAGRGHKGLKLLGFNTVPCVYRDVLFDFKKPYDSLIFLVDFPAITLTFPPNKNNRGIWIAWLTCC